VSFSAVEIVTSRKLQPLAPDFTKVPIVNVEYVCEPDAGSAVIVPLVPELAR